MASEPKPVVYTIGHSRHAIDAFVALLVGHRIERVIDTRGQPWSRFNPQFNRGPFRRALEAAGIGYEWRGDRLSGRPREREFRGADGEVLWERLRASPALAAALDEVAARARTGERLALACAEEDPRRCHRRFLLTAPLVARGLEVLHVRGDGRIEAESALRAQESGGQIPLFDGEERGPRGP